MFGRSKNTGMSKFIRGFRRLKKILQFARDINIEVDPFFIDLSQLTLLQIRERELKTQGLHLMDVAEYNECEIINKVDKGVCLNSEIKDQIKDMLTKIREIKQRL